MKGRVKLRWGRFTTLLIWTFKCLANRVKENKINIELKFYFIHIFLNNFGYRAGLSDFRHALHWGLVIRFVMSDVIRVTFIQCLITWEIEISYTLSDFRSVSSTVNVSHVCF